MDVVPAIDLRGGKCVRLFQGDYSRETVYSEDPLGVAARWVGFGASRLHVVDLDGAKSGAPANLSIVGDVASSVEVPVQLGGGMRSVEVAREAMSRGADRIVVGTAAVEDPELVRRLCEQLGADAVVVGLDARNGYAAVKGWTQTTNVKVIDLVLLMEEMGVRRFMYTDVARDGTLTEPNFHAIGDVADCTGAQLMVAGGISSVQHILRLAGMGVEAAIVGKALYAGEMDLREALEALHQSYKQDGEARIDDSQA